MVTKADLHQFIDELPDDEPETDEERTAMAEAYEAEARGDVFTDEELRRELGL